MDKVLSVKVPYRKVTLKHYLDPYKDGVRLFPITVMDERTYANSYSQRYKASGYVEMMLPFDDTTNYSFVAAINRDDIAEEAKRRKIRHMICKITLDLRISFNDYIMLLKDNIISLYEHCFITLEGYLADDNIYVDLKDVDTIFSAELSIYATETFRQLGSESSVYSTRIITRVTD